MQHQEPVLTVLTEMLKARNYEITEENGRIFGIQKNDAICAYLTKYDKISIKDINEVYSNCQKENINHVIIVGKTITPAAKKEALACDIEMEIFFEKELQFNITKHKLVPIHKILSKEESDHLRKTVRKITKLPLIIKTDPIYKFYNYKPGQIIKIFRMDGSISYRYCA